MKFVLFHGAFGSPEGNWFPQLKEKLEALGQEVVTPQFPVENWDDITKAGLQAVPQHQKLVNWLEVFESVYKTLNKGGKFCFVGHSLGPLFILHAVECFNIQLDSAIFVSPFLDKLNSDWQIDLVNASFYKTDFDFEKLKKLIPVSYTLYSDNDPYVDKNHSTVFAKALESSLIYVKKAGHMNSEVNLNEFPLVFDLCTTRLDLSLYQQYLNHRGARRAIEYIREKAEGRVYLEPSEIEDEGVFHFRNLGSEGFCTFYTAGLSFWDPRSRYMEEARMAARRLKNFARVFILDKASDAQRPRLRQQISLDLAAGIAIYVCSWSDIRGEVKETDFGIWDNDYVCTVRYGEKPGVVREIELSSKSADLEQANVWKRIILAKAHQVQNMQDLV